MELNKDEYKVLAEELAGKYLDELKNGYIVFGNKNDNYIELKCLKKAFGKRQLTFIVHLIGQKKIKYNIYTIPKKNINGDLYLERNSYLLKELYKNYLKLMEELYLSDEFLDEDEANNEPLKEESLEVKPKQRYKIR